MFRLMVLVFWCSVAALITAVVVGENLAVSLRIWLAAFVSWFGLALLVRFFLGVRLVPARWQLLAVSNKSEQQAPRALHDFRTLENLLLRARRNDRTHRRQLRPRLAALADHSLLVHHGINRQAEPGRASTVLGDVAWLLDDDESLPTPTLEEIDRFLDRISSPSPTNPAQPATMTRKQT